MPRMAARNGAHLFLALLAALGADASSVSLAQDLPFALPREGGPEFSGRDFGGVVFPQAPVTGDFFFAATTAYLWEDGTCRRMLLSGNVRVRLGAYAFEARRAAVWMDSGGTSPAGPVQQVFVYFQEVGGSGAAAGAASFSAEALPVRAMIVPLAPPSLKADVLVQGPPAGRGPRQRDDAALLAEGESALAAVLARMAGSPPPPAPPAGPHSGPTPAELTRRIEPPAPGPIFARQGIITVAPGSVTIVSGQDENAIIASDTVAVAYTDRATGRTLQITAQRAVIFLDPGRIADMGRLTLDNVRGIYLEGDVVATDGKYTLRGPQVYYDVRRNKAIQLDAVFWTYDERRRVPLYVRADSIRQESAEQFSARNAVFTNSAFFDPELSIGASSVTITREQRTLPREGLRSDPDSTETRNLVEARNVTLRALGVPFLWWPYYRGDPDLFPLKDFRFENRTGVGGSLKTRWNIHSLFGRRTPPGFGADLISDWYFERGLALGADLHWDGPDSRGGLFAYSLLSDRGNDRLPTGADVSPGSDTRALFTVEQRWRISEHWTLLGEGAYISDESFVPAFFEPMGKSRREFATRLYARRAENNSVFTAQVKGSLNDFIANEYLLQSQGYSVARLPELAYTRQADDLLGQSAPGALTWFSEYRASRLELQFDENSAFSRGMNTLARSQRALGIDPAQSPADALRAAGYSEDAVHRLDTRQELAARIPWGPVIFNPFIVARATGYDDEFESFSPSNDQNVRLWSAAGLRASTTIARVYEDTESRTLDLHRLRHIIEPAATLWAAGATVEGRSLPTYDENVENLADGAIARFGVRQILQTQRGGPGRWYSTDVLTLDTSLVVASGDTNPKTPIGRFFDFRPEYANPGNYFVADASWRVTEALALTASEVFDFDAGQQAMTSAGILLYHAPGFVTGLDARFINSQDSTIFSLGTRYDLSAKYSFSIGGSYDASRGGFQGGGVEVRRRFSSLLMGINVGYNDISGETGLGFVIIPYGATGEGRVTGIGSSSTAATSGGFN